MDVIRLLLRLVALVMILVLSACGSSASETAELHTARTNSGISTPTMGIPATQPARRMAEGPIPLLLPVRLVIPAIAINASIESVGIRSDSDLATPTRHPWEDVGWYDLGPLPSERGSAVIDGHLDRPGGSPAVFWRLREIQVGDDVQVTRSAGKTLHFRVTRIAYYPPGQAPLQDIFGNLGGKYLNLITCAGDWIPGQHQTTLRLVVYTSLE
jgi:Sortase domain